MAGFLRDVGAATVATFAAMGIVAVVTGAITWWPDEQLRPWVLAGCYVAFVSLVVSLWIWILSGRDLQPMNDFGAALVILATMSPILVVGYSAWQIVVDAHTAHEIGWILTMNLAVVLLFRVAFTVNEALRKRIDTGVVKVTYSMSPRGRAIWGSILRIVSTVFYALVVWALIFICDVNTGSATWEDWSEWRPQPW